MVSNTTSSSRASTFFTFLAKYSFHQQKRKGMHRRGIVLSSCSILCNFRPPIRAQLTSWPKLLVRLFSHASCQTVSSWGSKRERPEGSYHLFCVIFLFRVMYFSGDFASDFASESRQNQNQLLDQQRNSNRSPQEICNLITIKRIEGDLKLCRKCEV